MNNKQKTEMERFVSNMKKPSFSGKVDIYSFAHTRNTMEKLLTLASKQNISIKQLAKIARISEKQLQRYIDVTDFLTFEDLQKLCIAVNATFKVEIFPI